MEHVRIGRRYNIESVDPVDIEPGARVVWLLTEDGKSWEFLAPGALVTVIGHISNPETFHFTVVHDGYRSPLSVVVKPGQPLDVRFDDGVLPVRLYRWVWHYLVAFFEAIVEGVKWAVRKVGAFFNRLIGNGRWHW